MPYGVCYEASMKPTLKILRVYGVQEIACSPQPCKGLKLGAVHQAGASSERRRRGLDRQLNGWT